MFLERKSEKGKKRREIRSIWKKKLIENTHSLVVSKKKFLDKIKEEEKLYCLEPDGDESFVEGVVGTFEKFFLLHRFCL